MFPCMRPGPWAGGHSEWRPGGRSPGSLHPPRNARRAARPGASGLALPEARGSRRRIRRARSGDLPRRRAVASGAARRPGSDYRFTRGAGPAAAQPRRRALPAPLPRLRILLHSCGRPAPPPPPPPPPARPPSPPPPPAARIGWRPRRRHFPTARGACGSPAALQARPWRAASPIGARGAGRGRGRRPACVPARPPQPARRRPTAARASSFPPAEARQSPCGADTPPPGRGGRRGRARGSPSPLASPPPRP